MKTAKPLTAQPSESSSELMFTAQPSSSSGGGVGGRGNERGVPGIVSKQAKPSTAIPSSESEVSEGTAAVDGTSSLDSHNNGGG